MHKDAMGVSDSVIDSSGHVFLQAELQVLKIFDAIDASVRRPTIGLFNSKSVLGPEMLLCLTS